MTCPSRLLCHTGTDWQKKSKRRHKKLAGTGGADAAAKRACTLSRLSKVNEIVILHTAYALALMSEKASSSPPLSPPPAFLLLFLLLSRNSSSETGVPPPPQPNDTACSGAVDHDGAGSSSGQEEVVDVNDASGSDQLDIHAKAPEDCKALSLSRARALARWCVSQSDTGEVPDVWNKIVCVFTSCVCVLNNIMCARAMRTCLHACFFVRAER